MDQHVHNHRSSLESLGKDVAAGLVVFLIALPLCLGIAIASGAPPVAGLVSGIVGGIVVGWISGSHTSVSGPAAGLAAVVLSQVTALGSFEVFLLTVVIAGVLQIAFGLARAGMLAGFVSTSVIKGLLAAIGIILILKQLPHLLGHDTDPEGQFAFDQPDHDNTFSSLMAAVYDLHPGAALVGLSALALLIAWARIDVLSRSRVPAPVAAVALGLVLESVLQWIGGPWTISSSHLVQVPLAKDVGGVLGLVPFPELSAFTRLDVYSAAFTLAVVASLETLLNLEAVDKLDPKQRVSPGSRELVAQGVGNVVAGFMGGIPVVSEVVRGSVNIDAGATSKRATIVHGVLLFAAVLLLPGLLNRIPLASLAAVLLVTGFRLASPRLVRRMWQAGRSQFIPFIATILAIVLTDLLVGLVFGMAVSLFFIITRHARRPVRRIAEKHVGGDVLHIELPVEVSFLKQRALQRVLEEVPRGGHVLLDARQSDHIDPDVLEMIREYRDMKAPARGIHLSMVGFDGACALDDEIQFVDYSTRELQDQITPAQVLEILRQGNDRFQHGRRINRDHVRQIDATKEEQHPLAVVLSCIDSRTPAEIVFDVGLGDIFSVRIAGNTLSPKVLGSMEYGTAAAGARLIVVMGHTRCGAVTAAVDLVGKQERAAEATRCQHLDHVLSDLQRVLDHDMIARAQALPRERRREFIDGVARRNVLHVVKQIVAESETIRRLVDEGRIAIVGGLYDVSTGKMDFMLDAAIGLPEPPEDGFRTDANEGTANDLPASALTSVPPA